MNKYAVRIIGMSLVVASIGAVMVVLVPTPGYFSYTRLINVAKTLPNYEGVVLPSGARGEKPCYFHYDSSICRALSINVKAEQGSDVEAKKFINASQSKGVKWSDYNDKLTLIGSHVFVRDGRNYQIYIEHEKNGAISISLLEY